MSTHNEELARMDRTRNVFYTLTYPVSCGVGGLGGLAYPPEVLVRATLYPNHRVDRGAQSALAPTAAPWARVTHAHVIFSDTANATSPGHKLAAFIEQHKIGEVIKSGHRKNPNSGNDIVVWVWTLPATVTPEMRVALGFKD